jgi:hypothetical protein
MFAIVRTAVRFFFVGFGVGVLLAPRSGAETRALIRERLNTLADAVLEIAALPPLEPEPPRATSTPQTLRARRPEGTGAGTA